MNKDLNLNEEIEKILEDYNMELVELNVKKRNNPLLEVIIFNEDGTSLDDCQLISREIEERIDLDSFFERGYNIEVASPGLDRKLKTSDDFRRNLNNDVDLSLYSKVNGEKKYIGKLIDYDEENVYIKTEENDRLEINRDNIAVMRQHIDFGGKKN